MKELSASFCFRSVGPLEKVLKQFKAEAHLFNSPGGSLLPKEVNKHGVQRVDELLWFSLAWTCVMAVVTMLSIRCSSRTLLPLQIQFSFWACWVKLIFPIITLRNLSLMFDMKGSKPIMNQKPGLDATFEPAPLDDMTMCCVWKKECSASLIEVGTHSLSHFFHF